MFRLILNTPTKCKYGHMDRWNNLFSPSNTISFIRYFTPNMERTRPLRLYSLTKECSYIDFSLVSFMKYLHSLASIARTFNFLPEGCLSDVILACLWSHQTEEKNYMLHLEPEQFNVGLYVKIIFDAQLSMIMKTNFLMLENEDTWSLSNQLSIVQYQHHYCGNKINCREQTGWGSLQCTMWRVFCSMFNVGHMFDVCE